MIGHKLNERYELLELVGQGAAGYVYKARDTQLGRDVSVQVLSQLDENTRQRLIRNAEAAVNLDHPNLAAVYAVGEDADGTSFVVTEYIEGLSLADYIPSPPETVIHLGRQIASALEYVHERGFVHGDIQPANIKVTPNGQVKILDLGLKPPQDSSDLVAAGTIAGGLTYLAPEQVKGLSADTRTDIYALGVVLYEMATGRPPFRSDDLPAQLMQQVTLPPPSPRSVAPDVPVELEAVILKALEKEPESRYQTMDEMASALLEPASPAEPALPPSPSPTSEEPFASDSADTPDSTVIMPDQNMSWRDEARRQRIADGVATLDDLEIDEQVAVSDLKEAVEPQAQTPRAEVDKMDSDDKLSTEGYAAAETNTFAEPVPESEPAKPLLDMAPAVDVLPLLGQETGGSGAAPAADYLVDEEEAVPDVSEDTQPLPSVIMAPGASSGTSADGSPVQFSAYYPREVMPEEWHVLHAYAFRQSAARAVTEDIHHQLGSLLPAFRAVSETSQRSIPEGEIITATPNLPGFRFNPPSINLAFYESWHRFDFKLQAYNAPLNQAANGWLTFSLDGVIVADIPLSVFVGEAVTSDHLASASARLYQSIFCSYSHEDTGIVERVERAYKALGLDYLRDVVSLKSGTHWSEELLELIDKADIFQLFWSPAAAESKYVRQEWEHALNLKRDEANFIRPVYWQQPMPPPPELMSHIHFAYQPDLDA